MAGDTGDIILPRRSFTDVHELVYLFHSWQLILQADDVPEIFRSPYTVPEHLVPVMTSVLAEAQAQLESAQAGTDIALRFRVTPGFIELMEWGAVQLKEIDASLDGQKVRPVWRRALELAGDLVSAALESSAEVRLAD